MLAVRKPAIHFYWCRHGWCIHAVDRQLGQRDVHSHSSQVRRRRSQRTTPSVSTLDHIELLAMALFRPFEVNQSLTSTLFTGWSFSCPEPSTLPYPPILTPKPGSKAALTASSLLWTRPVPGTTPLTLEVLKPGRCRFPSRMDSSPTIPSCTMAHARCTRRLSKSEIRSTG